MTPSEFKTQFPEFEGETDERLRLFISRAAPHFDIERWGDLYPEGVANFVAHELTRAKVQAAQGGGASDTLNKRVGDVSIGKDAGLLAKQADNPFYRTLYGQKYLTLRRQVGMGALSV